MHLKFINVSLYFNNFGFGFGFNNYYNNIKNFYLVNSSINNFHSKSTNKITLQLGAYLAGLIEGAGTFAVHNTTSTAKKYLPMIIIVFKKADLPLAEYLQNITQCGKVYLKTNRGYVIWEIQDLVSVFTMVTIINGYMRTPKIIGLQRTIQWFNLYIKNNQNSRLSKTKLNLDKIYPLEVKPLDNSPVDSNSWLAGFSDAIANFSINIHERSNKNSTRVKLFFRLEIKQNYHRLDPEGVKVSYFSIMSILANFLDVNVYSKSRISKDKQFYSFNVICTNKNSLLKITEYFNKFPLLSSKYLDYKDWCYLLELQSLSGVKTITTSYLDQALNIRKDFNNTRTTYYWDHLSKIIVNYNK